MRGITEPAPDFHYIYKPYLLELIWSTLAQEDELWKEVRNLFPEKSCVPPHGRAPPTPDRTDIETLICCLWLTVAVKGDRVSDPHEALWHSITIIIVCIGRLCVNCAPPSCVRHSIKECARNLVNGLNVWLPANTSRRTSHSVSSSPGRRPLSN